jgi:ATP-dependent DNA helicase DinG
MDRAGSFFSPGGRLSRAHPAYENRPGQEAMARAVERVLGDGGSLMVEAGTGTGKTLAYLVPALASDRRVIVSTGTRNLQDQIFNQDLPFLRDRAGLSVSACLMKGRDNYLCRYRLAEFAREPLLEVADERQWLPVIEEWSRETTTGTRCPEYENCWLTRMKRRAQESQVVVVNHHLFFADLALRTAFGAVLPDYDTVVFDEAHLLEETATLYFGVQVSSAQVEELARDAERGFARTGDSPKGGGGAAALRNAAREFFRPLREIAADGAGRVPFLGPERGGPELDDTWGSLAEAISEVAARAGRHASGGDALDAIERKAEELHAATETVLGRDDPAYVYGLEIRGRGTVVLSAAPIDVSVLLRETLFDNLHASVLTSATLAIENRFDFFRKRLGLEDAETAVVESPFDHRAQAVLYLPPRMAEPREREFIPRVVDEIHNLLELSRGRAFLLFTSYANMDRVRSALEIETEWPLLVQGDGSKVALVERFKTTPRGVLLGTTSFWHGVDVPGEALSMVVIDKLPYDVPSDPLIAARIERIRDEGGNPFVEYQTPLAVLELKQGLGRLLRSRADRGVLAVMDPRLVTKRYGKTFLGSLPPYRVVRDLEACREFLE